jgi:uncharacterized protein YndB with AHSA1/START domain
LGKIERSIVINAPPEKVWKMLALDKFPEWMDIMERVEYTSNVRNQKDKYKVGATAVGTPKGGPPDNCHYEITESVENEKFMHQMWEKWLRRTLGGPVTYTLEPIDGGTKLTMMGVLEMPWGILLKIVEPLILRMGRKEFEKSLDNLKSILEK